MRLVSAHISPLGNFLLGLDCKLKYHGVFCWSALHIAEFAHDWRISQEDVRLLVKAMIANEIDLFTNRDPEIVHGIGAALIGKQFATMKHVREIVHKNASATLTNGRIYFHTKPSDAPHIHEATLLFYVTPEGSATLAHLRTKDQAANLLLWEEDWIDESGREQIEKTMDALREEDPSSLRPTYVQGRLIQQLITAQILYRSLFPEDEIARN